MLCSEVMYQLQSEGRDERMPQQMTRQRPDAADEFAPPSYWLTYHGLRRTAQRNLAPDQVAYTLAHGRRVRRTGVDFYFLGARDLPPADRRDARRARLIGTVLIVKNGAVITAYRNPDALRCIKRKLKYRLTSAERAAVSAAGAAQD